MVIIIRTEISGEHQVAKADSKDVRHRDSRQAVQDQIARQMDR